MNAGKKCDFANLKPAVTLGGGGVVFASTTFYYYINTVRDARVEFNNCIFSFTKINSINFFYQGCFVTFIR